ncbi:OmpA family protein [Roseibium sp. RKSG952]|uniref:OmpA family protein n=1 Tax=Roseibium sp. RKSG952 TaxID=2529384 RepID=UPI0012BB9004|nr:OmpA family protein [Roseibium sp. RKSG952]MTI03239.1 hypothetical protein [Roseibium sp. RKSG952]
MTKRVKIPPDGRCVVVDKGQRCPKDAVDDGKGLLCEGHLAALGKEKISVLTSLKSAEISKLLDLSAKEPTKPPSRLADMVFSTPGLLVITGTTIVALLERVWRHELGIVLPIGDNSSTFDRFLSAEFVILVLIFASLYLLAALAAWAVLYVVGVVISPTLVTLLKGGWLQLAVLTLKHRIKFLAVQIGLRFGHGRGMEQAVKMRIEREFERNKQAELALARRMRDSYEATRNMWIGRTNNAVGFWVGALLNSKQKGINPVLVRMGLIAILAGSLILTTKNIAGEVKGKIETASKNCTSISVGHWILDRLEKLELPIAARIPCGRIVMSAPPALENFRIVDAGLSAEREGPVVSKPVFHLGKYGGWAALAPVDEPGRLVFLNASTIRQFQLEDAKPSLSLPQLYAQKTHQLASSAIALTSRIQNFLSDPRVDTEVQIARLEQEVKLLRERPPLVVLQPTTVNETQKNLTVELVAEFAGGTILEDTLEDLGGAANSLAVAAEALAGSGGKDPLRPLQVYWGQLANQLGTDALDACRRENDDKMPTTIYFNEGMVDPIDNQKIVDFAKKMKTHNPGKGRLIVQLKGRASTSGLPEENRKLADRRADRVKHMLIEHTFDLSSSKASAEGHSRLEEAKITILTYEQGEAIDPVESQKFESARRVEVEYCLIPAIAPANTDSAQLANK